MNNRQPMNSGIVQVVAGAILASTIVYAVIGVVALKVGMMPALIEPSAATLLGIVFCAAGVPLALLSLLIRRALLAKGAVTLADKMRVTVICLAVADSAGILGLVYALLAGNLGASFILWGASIGVGILLFPSRSWLEEDGASSDERR